MTLIAITNPSDESAEASIVVDDPRKMYAPRSILDEFGDRIEDGAQVVMIDGGRVWQYLATRSGNDSVALRNNNALGLLARTDGQAFIEYMNDPDIGQNIIECIDLSSASGEFSGNGEDWQTFTVFGTNDDGERFSAVVTARSEEGAYRAGKYAGTLDDEFECDVRIDVILKGDHSDIETVNISEVE